MNTTSRHIALAALAAGAFLAGCLPGPWEYAPEAKPIFRGVTMTAYAVAGRPAQDVCFERLLDLKESSTDARTWFDSASVGITGTFSNGGQTLVLQPKPGPANCFQGAPGTLFVKGQSYTISARLVWDSAGTRTVTNLSATARIPLDFSVKDTAYAPRFALTGVGAAPSDPAGLFPVPYRNGDSVYYLSEKKFQGFNLSELPHYFGARFGSDVRAVLITRLFDTTESRPVNSFDSILGIAPTLSHFYQPGDMNRLALYPSMPLPGGGNTLDSMGIYNALFWTGRNRLYFYGVEDIYADYLSAVAESQGSAKVRLPTNVSGGQGFFAGMVVDSFDVYMKLDGFTQAFSYRAARAASCRETGWYDSRDCIGFYREYCRDTLWAAPTCRRDAGYAALDPVERLALPQAILDSVAAWNADTAYATEVSRRYCIDNDYPAGVAACASVKSECEEAPGAEVNGCHEILWDRCDLAYWALPACADGLKTYCRAHGDVAKILCRDVD